MNQPFSNGSEYCSWLSRNCEMCVKSATLEQMASGDPLPCAIENAIVESMITDEIPQEIVDRSGMVEDPWKWTCAELQTEPTPAVIVDDPAQCRLFGEGENAG